MNRRMHDTGIIQVLLKRLNSQRLPRALALRTRVDAGERLSESDLHFLREAVDDVHDVLPYIAARHPECRTVMCCLVHLYNQILGTALQNELREVGRSFTGHSTSRAQNESGGHSAAQAMVKH